MINEYINEMPKNITDNKGVYEFITNIYSRFDSITNSKIIFDFTATKYISPNTMSILGLIFTKIKAKKNTVFLRNTRPEIKSLLLRYGFLSINIDNNLEVIPQNFIKYETFSGEDDEGFLKYLDLQLSEIPNNETIASLKTHLMEIFINVKMHGRKKSYKKYKNKEVFTCGFYDKSTNKLIFSIANNGQSFYENITSKLKYTFNNEFKYLEWALKKANSTTKDRTGGLGLSMLFDLVSHCHGSLYILSGKGYYEYVNYNGKFNLITTDFSSRFPGTSITVKLPIIHIPTLDNKLINRKKISISDLLSGDEDII